MPPPRTNVPELLRWARRVQIGIGILFVFDALLFLLLGDETWWWFLVIGGGSILLAPLTTPAIRASERTAERDRREGVTAEELARRDRRGRRAGAVSVVLLVPAFGVVGYLLDGLGAAIFMSVLMSVCAVTGFVVDHYTR